MNSKLKEEYDNWHSQHNVTKQKSNNSKALLEFAESILKQLNIEKGEKILDVACGQSNILKIASEKGVETYGIDVSSVAVDKARLISPRSEILCGDAQNLPWEDNFFDYVTCIGSLEHFPRPEKGVKEISRVLKNSGRALILLPNSYFVGHIWWVWKTGYLPDEGNQEFSESFFTNLEGRKMLEDNGLKVLETTKWNTIWASRKVGILTKYAYNFLLVPFIPLNLSYAFIYLCKKS